MIYHKDISYQQYITIINFINKKIIEYKRTLINKSKEFQVLEKIFKE